MQRTTVEMPPLFDANLRYSESLSKIKTLFPETSPHHFAQETGRDARIDPSIFFGPNTTKKLTYFWEHHESYKEKPHYNENVSKAHKLLLSHKYVILGIPVREPNEAPPRQAEQLLLAGQNSHFGECNFPTADTLQAVELWRIRSSLFTFKQAAAICTHLNSFKRTKAYGKVLTYSIYPGPNPDEILSNWLKRLPISIPIVRREIGGLSHHILTSENFDLSQVLSVYSPICFEYGGHPFFSYKAPAPKLPRLYRINCAESANGVVSTRYVYPLRRRTSDYMEAIYNLIRYAEISGAYPPDAMERYLYEYEHYFDFDKSTTGCPIADREWQWSEYATYLFTAKETWAVIKYLRDKGYTNIKRVKSLNSYNGWISDELMPISCGTTSTYHQIPEIGLDLQIIAWRGS